MEERKSASTKPVNLSIEIPDNNNEAPSMLETKEILDFEVSLSTNKNLFTPGDTQEMAKALNEKPDPKNIFERAIANVINDVNKEMDDIISEHRKSISTRNSERVAE